MVSNLSAKHHNNRHLKTHSLVQSLVAGIPKEDLQPDRHWLNPWPQGPVDDGTDDDNIILPDKEKKKDDDENIKFRFVGR